MASKGKSHSAPNSLRALSPRHQKFVKAFADPNSSTFGNKTRSYLRAFPNASTLTARGKATPLSQKDAIRAAVVEYGREIGWTPEKVIGRLNEQLDATDEVYDMKTRQYRTNPDNSARLKAIDVSAKLLDLYPDSSKEPPLEVKTLIQQLYIQDSSQDNTQNT